MTSSLSTHRSLSVWAELGVGPARRLRGIPAGAGHEASHRDLRRKELGAIGPFGVEASAARPVLRRAHRAQRTLVGHLVSNRPDFEMIDSYRNLQLEIW